MSPFYKENNYRKILNKGHVYDSLDDDEESDEEDIYNCYIELNNKFLYILDSIILISSLILLLYFPIYLSKEKFFCKYIKNKDEILFYSIDLIFIIDLVINFYRAYYDYNEILIEKTILIIIHYLKTWFLLDFPTAIPFFTIIKQFEMNFINSNIYSDFKLDNINACMHFKIK